MSFYMYQKDAEEDEKLVVAFCDEETRSGRTMFHLLEKLADENSEHAGTLEIVLIDPGQLQFSKLFEQKLFTTNIVCQYDMPLNYPLRCSYCLLKTA